MEVVTRRTIVNAAIRVDGVNHEGRRHNEILKAAPTFGGFKDGIQGFVTNDGKFVSRKAAESIARRAGQLTGKMIGNELTSEDLW